ncbi:MAG: SDR family oxidoreductase [Anaerolineales bacterium]|nr:SDR family oxidoreductase [Anaerolineales bacterium]
MNLQELTHWYDFTGKTIVVTGGTGVLGGEIACGLIGCGANVAVLDRNPNLPDALRTPMDAGPGKYMVTYADVLDRATLDEAAQAILAAFGRVDMLINAAGGNHPQATTGAERSFFELPADAMGFVFDLNIMGTVLPSQVFGRLMADQGEGVILNVSSMNAFTPLTRIPAYSAAKAGVSNFTQWLAVHMAQEYSPHIRVNAIAPGFFLTKQNRFLLTDEQTGALTARGRQIIEHTPMGRFGSPEDLLGAVFWLLSPASAFVTGTIVPIDGGFHAYSGV